MTETDTERPELPHELLTTQAHNGRGVSLVPVGKERAKKYFYMQGYNHIQHSLDEIIPSTKAKEIGKMFIKDTEGAHMMVDDEATEVARIKFEESSIHNVIDKYCNAAENVNVGRGALEQATMDGMKDKLLQFEKFNSLE